MASRYFWNDDDRKNDYINYHEKEEEYVPVFKILKEMYDEDKANLYIYDAEEEYQYKYGQYYFNRYCAYYDEYSSVSNLDSDTYNISENDVVVPQDDVLENETENVDTEEQQEDCIDKITCKFIYT